MKRLSGILFAVLIVEMFALGVAYFYMQPGTDVSLTSNCLPTSIHIERDTLTLGTVKYGEKRPVAFRLSNTGTAPLFVHDVQTSCGCTGVEWSKHPLKPEKTLEIKIVFEPNSLGRFMKSIDVICNTTQQIHKLHLRGEVVE